MKNVIILIPILLISSAMANTSEMSEAQKQRRSDVIDSHKSLVIAKTSKRFQKILKEKFNNDLDRMKEEIEMKSKQMLQICKDTENVNKCYTENVATLPLHPSEIPTELNNALESIEDEVVKEELAQIEQEFSERNQDSLDSADDRFQQLDRGSEMLDNTRFEQY